MRQVILNLLVNASEAIALTDGGKREGSVDWQGEVIKATGSGDVKLELKDAQSAGQLRPAEGEDYKYRYIVMPMRI